MAPVESWWRQDEKRDCSPGTCRSQQRTFKFNLAETPHFGASTAGRSPGADDGRPERENI